MLSEEDNLLNFGYVLTVAYFMLIAEWPREGDSVLETYSVCLTKLRHKPGS